MNLEVVSKIYIYIYIYNKLGERPKAKTVSSD